MSPQPFWLEFHWCMGFRCSMYSKNMAYNFTEFLPTSPIHTLQINLTKLCNQACQHCNVDASPKRTESMSRERVEQCLELIRELPQIKTVDLTGGAPELHPQFRDFVKRATDFRRKVI